MNLVNKNAGLRLKKCIIFAFLLLPFAFTCAFAHTYHTSLTRMDYNAPEKTIEISVQLFIHDALPMLEKRLKKRVDIEKTAEVDAELLKYLGETFVLLNKKGETQKLRWVGREFENDVIYVYLEVPFTDSFEGVRLQNTIFFESFAQQTNLVIARFGEKKIDLLYKAGDKFKDL